MGNTGNKHGMHAEIQQRIQSDVWNIEIAGRILRHRKKSMALRLAGGAITAAASVMLVFFLGSGTGDVSTDINLHTFIGTQADGTYRQVFKQDKNEVSATVVSSLDVSYDAVDDIITASLAER